MLAKIDLGGVTSSGGFPWDVFSQEVSENFKQISVQYNIPLNYLGAEAIFIIAALAGNQYRGQLNFGIKPVVYLAKIGPSGVGKTPAYNRLCGDIIRHKEYDYQQDHKEKMRHYLVEQAVNKKDANAQLNAVKPIRRERIINDATQEAIERISIESPAGFGIVYDEGGQLFGIGKYQKGGGSSIDFWNTVFEGGTVKVSRVHSENDRFITNAAISLDIGLQTDRVAKYFTEDTIDSGLLNRFLVVESGYVPLNEDVDPFSESAQICSEWKQLVTHLWESGMTYTENKPNPVPFDDAAKENARRIAKTMVKDSNVIMGRVTEGDSSKYTYAYRSKLYQYFYRFCVILAIYENPRHPRVSSKHVLGAEKLCMFFEGQSKALYKRIVGVQLTGLTEQEQKLLAALPQAFTSEQAELICDQLKLGKKFFLNTFTRKFSKSNVIWRTGRGQYEKQVD